MPYKLPDEMFRQLGGVSTREEALWTCQTCGIIEPRAYLNGFVRGQCTCQSIRIQHELTTHHQQRKEQHRSLNRLGRPFQSLVRLPDEVFRRLGGMQREVEAQRTCPACGPIAPKRYANGYLPGRCTCEEREKQQQREQQERLKQWHTRQEHRKRSAQRCYTWLGADFDKPLLRTHTFERFEMESQPEGFLAAFEFAERITAHDRDPAAPLPGNLILWSDTSWGTGKTHLAAAVCQTLIDAGIPCRFATGGDLFRAISRRFDEKRGIDDLLREACETPLLVIDDIDKIYVSRSGYVQATLFDIFDRRYLQRLPTLITTNQRIESTQTGISGLESIVGPAVCSRLKEHGLVCVCMNGKDYRHWFGQ